MSGLGGKVAIVTGAYGGLGRAVSRKLADAGARLVLVGRDAAKLQVLIDALNVPADRVLGVPTDVTDEDQIARVVESAMARFGQIDSLFNIVGGWAGGTTVADTDVATWDHMLRLNLRSVFIVSRAVLPHMAARGYGKIVNVSSKTATQSGKNRAAYAVAKAGVLKLTEAMAAEFKDSGINVNAVLPSTIDTEANRRAMPNADFSKWVMPEEIADVMLWLASDEASTIHGAAVPVYGLA